MHAVDTTLGYKCAEHLGLQRESEVGKATTVTDSNRTVLEPKWLRTLYPNIVQNPQPLRPSVQFA